MTELQKTAIEREILAERRAVLEGRIYWANYHLIKRGLL